MMQKEDLAGEKPSCSKQKSKMALENVKRRKGSKRSRVPGENTPVRENRKVYFQLETDIIWEILLRVSIESLLACRCVCKTWYNMTRSPDFIDIQKNISSKQPPRFVCQTEFANRNRFSYNNAIIPRDIANRLLFWDSEEDKTWKMPLNGNSMRTRRIKFSYNGLLCIAPETRGSQASLVICNPLTNECIKLPRTDGVKKNSSSQVGFCFVPARQEHIVVQLFSTMDKECRGMCIDVVNSIYILTSGQRRWRLLSHPLCINYDEFLGEMIYWKNAFHWTVKKGYCMFGRECILSFDTLHETFQVISFPDDNLGGFLDLNVLDLNALNLVVLNDRLTLTERYGNKMKLWEVKGDKVGEFSLVCREVYDDIDHDANPFSVFVVTSNDTKPLKTIEIDGLYCPSEMSYYYPTLVSVHSMGFA